MELTTNINQAEDGEAVTQVESAPRINRGFILLALFGVLTIGGCIAYSSGLFDSIGKSKQVQELLVLIGMGPKAGFYRLIAPISGALIIALFSLSFLGGSGRDARQTKEQSTKAKKEREKPPENQGANAKPVAVEEPEECNLATYKLFFGSKETTPAPEATSSKPTDAELAQLVASSANGNASATVGAAHS